MSDFFISQWGFLEIFFVAVILFLIVAIVLTLPITQERWELEDLQRDSIRNMECKQLGEFILGDEILYTVKELADRHWNVRCN